MAGSPAGDSSGGRDGRGAGRAGPPLANSHSVDAGASPRSGNGRGFVWPPRGVEPDQCNNDGATCDASSSGAPTPDVAMINTPERGVQGPGEPLVRAIRTFERSVLGGASFALPSNWCPESQEDYCSRCAGTIGIGEANAAGCATCRASRLAWSHAVRLGPYSGVLREGIIACKYRSDRAVGQRLGMALGEQVQKMLSEKGLLDERLAHAGMAVVPVPTTLRRRLSNSGLDHARVLARGVGTVLGISPISLLRRRHGSRQVATSAAERARNVRGAFATRSGRTTPQFGVIILVDDVRTTGATASSCFRELAIGYQREPRIGRQIGKAVDGEQSVRGEGAPVFVLATAAVSESRRQKTALTTQKSGSGGKT